MTNILWRKPDGTLAVTLIAGHIEKYIAPVFKRKKEGKRFVDVMVKEGYVESTPIDPKDEERNLREKIPEVFSEYKTIAYGVALPPNSDDFQEAWDWDGNTVFVDMDKAIELHKSRLRMDRVAKLEAQDVAYSRYQRQNNEEGMKDTLVEIERLKNITKLADKCRTIEDLRKVVL